MTSTMASRKWHRATLISMLITILWVSHWTISRAADPTTLAHPQNQSTHHQTGVVGQWRSDANALLIEFKADGTYQVRTPQGHNKGHWAQLDAEHLATWISSTQPKRVNRFRLFDGKLIITDQRGAHHIHHRIYTWPDEKQAIFTRGRTPVPEQQPNNPANAN